MKLILLAAIWGVIVATGLALVGILIASWQWWVIAIPCFFVGAIVAARIVEGDKE